MDDTASAKAFGIPEILEHMLSYLNVASLLRMERVSYSFHDSIKTSTKLQRRLGYQANERSYLRFPICELNHDFGPGFIRNGETGCAMDFENPSVRFAIEHFGHTMCGPLKQTGKVRTVGSRVRFMLACQPSVAQMKAHTDCCRPDSRGVMMGRQPTPEVKIITCSSGLTYGDLVDAVLALREEHKLCPYAAKALHDKEGVVVPSVIFSGSVQLLEADLVVKRERVFQATMKKRAAISDRLDRYIAAKTNAVQNNLPTPMWAEFEASNP